MYNMLIVDDEPTVRFGLRNYFDWSPYGIEVVAEADDGDTALEAAERTRPDLVLTDVRMPNMDGIRMSNELRRRMPNIKIVFISGHDDAEYLKSALKVNAVDYILKPVNLDELRTVIERVVQALNNEQSQRKLIGDMSVKLIESMPLLREKFLMSLVRDGVSRPSAVRQRLDFLEFDLPLDASYWVIVIRIDNSSEVVDTRSERDKQLLSYAVLNICQELVDKHLGGYAFENQNGEFVAILRLQAEERENLEERLFALAEDIRHNLERWLKLSVTIGVGERVFELAGLSRSYRHASQAADCKWYLGKNRIITMDSLEQPEEGFNSFGPMQVEKLSLMLNAADSEPLCAELRTMFSSLAANHREGFKYGRNVCLQIMLLAGQTMLELNVLTREMEEREEELRERLFRKETIEELRILLESYLVHVCERLRERRNGKSKNLIERVNAIIEERYADNLTVSDIGKDVFLTSTYVSLLYKQETGKTVGEYLTEVRMENAKRMLRDPQIKLYDICFAVGYSDPSYFSKLFKKTTGLTPSQYRSHVL